MSLKILSPIVLVFLAIPPYLMGKLDGKYINEKLNSCQHPTLLYAISAILIAMSIISIVHSIFSKAKSYNKYHSTHRWCLLSEGAVCIFGGSILALLLWFKPGTFGISSPCYILGSFIFNISIILGSTLWFYSSRINHPANPNLMRILVSSIVALLVLPVPILLAIFLPLTQQNALTMVFMAYIILGALISRLSIENSKQ